MLLCSLTSSRNAQCSSQRGSRSVSSVSWNRVPWNSLEIHTRVRTHTPAVAVSWEFCAPTCGWWWSRSLRPPHPSVCPCCHTRLCRHPWPVTSHLHASAAQASPGPWGWIGTGQDPASSSQAPRPPGASTALSVHTAPTCQLSDLGQWGARGCSHRRMSPCLRLVAARSTCL